jgi:hypothetical protein
MSRFTNIPANVAIGSLTVQSIAKALYSEATYWANVAPVQISAHKQFMRPTIYMWRLASTDGHLVMDVATYGQSGDMWQVSTDDGSTWCKVASLPEVHRLIAVYFASVY